jgi:hypothetical protein
MTTKVDMPYYAGWFLLSGGAFNTGSFVPKQQSQMRWNMITTLLRCWRGRYGQMRLGAFIMLTDNPLEHYPMDGFFTPFGMTLK